MAKLGGGGEDVDPYDVDDFAYVFREAEMVRCIACRMALPRTMTDNEVRVWRFVDVADVPPGQWSEIVTSGNNRLR